MPQSAITEGLLLPFPAGRTRRHQHPQSPLHQETAQNPSRPLTQARGKLSLQQRARVPAPRLVGVAPLGPRRRGALCRLLLQQLLRGKARMPRGMVLRLVRRLHARAQLVGGPASAARGALHALDPERDPRVQHAAGTRQARARGVGVAGGAGAGGRAARGDRGAAARRIEAGPAGADAVGRGGLGAGLGAAGPVGSAVAQRGAHLRLHVVRIVVCVYVVGSEGLGMVYAEHEVKEKAMT